MSFDTLKVEAPQWPNFQTQCILRNCSLLRHIPASFVELVECSVPDLTDERWRQVSGN
jgi:hypothetical protein